MDELTRKRMEKINKWTMEQTIHAIGYDFEKGLTSNKFDGRGKVIRIMCLCVVQDPETKSIDPVVYSAGFESIPEELGYIEVMRDKLMAWWRG